MNAVATIDQTNAPTLQRLDGLVEWVIHAPVEEVCWRITEIGSMRQWLAAQNEATELRIRAVRLELIALRKVAQGGLSKKIGGHAETRRAAEWLASLTDEEFAQALREIDGVKTPIALYRADKVQREAMTGSLYSPEYPQPGRDTSPDNHGVRVSLSGSLDTPSGRASVTQVLSSIIETGDPFTVAEVADSLADALGLDSHLRRETADGLREMVRHAIRHSDASHRSENPRSLWNSIPVAFTVRCDDGTYVRVPSARATLGHLFAHVEEVQARAEAAMERAAELRKTLSCVVERAGSTLTDIEGEGLFVYEVQGADSVLDRPLAGILRSSPN